MKAQSEELDWKLVVKSLKTSTKPDRKLLIEEVIREQTGDEVPLRAARKVLLMLAVDALAARPRLVSVRGEGVVCIVGLGDLLEVLAEPGPTLGEVMAALNIGAR